MVGVIGVLSEESELLISFYAGGVQVEARIVEVILYASAPGCVIADVQSQPWMTLRDFLEKVNNRQ